MEGLKMEKKNYMLNVFSRNVNGDIKYGEKFFDDIDDLVQYAEGLKFDLIHVCQWFFIMGWRVVDKTMVYSESVF